MMYRWTNPEVLDVIRADYFALIQLIAFLHEYFWLSVGGDVLVANVLFWLLPTSGSEISGHFCYFCGSDTLQAVSR